jgi:hypothetical protein
MFSYMGVFSHVKHIVDGYKIIFWKIDFDLNF